MTRIYSIAIVALLLNGCTDATNNLPQPKSQQTSNVVKIKVFADGRILADDQVIDLTQVAQRFSELKESSGAVWYYREAAEGEPHPNAMRVIELIVEYKLPVSMSTKPDFSNVVEPDGTPRSR